MRVHAPSNMAKAVCNRVIPRGKVFAKQVRIDAITTDIADEIIFDLEIAFLVPWAVVLDTISGEAFAAMGIFLFILVIGFIYEWKKGALEWE